MTKQKARPPAHPENVELTREKSEAMAAFLAELLTKCDVLLGVTRFGVIDYLEEFKKESRRRQYVQDCLSYNPHKSEKLDIELETLDGVLALLRARKKQVERMRDLKQEEDGAKEFQDFINSLI